LFAGDVDSYVKKILEAMALGKSQEHYVKASDGRIVLAKNEPLPGGGWVSTHEDVTEQRRAEEERAAIRGQEERRASIDSAITSFGRRSRHCFFSAEVVRDASEAVDHPVANLRLEVEDFLGKVAV
jgi:hypothetical protein